MSWLRRRPLVSEKTTRRQAAPLLAGLGGKRYSIGNPRGAGDHQGTGQTEGFADEVWFLPAPKYRTDGRPVLLFWEAKRPIKPARFTPEQQEFRDLVVGLTCDQVAHVVGALDPLFAFLIAGGWLRADGVAHYRRPPSGDQAP